MKWMCQFSGRFLVIRTPSPVTVEIQRSRKAKPFVVPIDKVKPYLAATPTLAEPNLMDSDEQHNDEVMAEHLLSQQEEVRLDIEVINHFIAKFDGYLCRRRSLYPNETEANDPSSEAFGQLSNNVRVVAE